MAVEIFLQHSVNHCENYFFHNYANARQQFLTTADSLGVTTTEQTWSLTNELHCDSFWVGPETAENVLLLISGTHGVEGYCGSAVQTFILQAIGQGAITLPANCALLCIHALNPWGMQHYRRCDHAGIDLNRNFINFTQLPATDPNYLLFVEQLLAAPAEQRFNTFTLLSEQFGQAKFDEAFSSGQYEFPWGPFYGGQQPAWSNTVIEEIIQQYKLNKKLLVVLDIHSGLGPWGFGELISDHQPGSAAAEFANQLFGPAVAHTLAGDSFSVAKRGLLDYRWHQLMHEQGCFLTLEFGSYGSAALFNVILDDHIVWRERPTKSSAAIAQQAQHMLEHFCPKQTLWQQAVLFKSWQVVNLACNQLQGR
ncbi:MAG: DUF2817 domain-containing protein [Gammaproteobacteria bacterium]|nr:DUF2817 domain-containing protein [Gammaproteobacteria bacterium]